VGRHAGVRSKIARWFSGQAAKQEHMTLTRLPTRGFGGALDKGRMRSADEFTTPAHRARAASCRGQPIAAGSDRGLPWRRVLRDAAPVLPVLASAGEC
jgi:hypothetical protein